jgi:secreted trypsin-like serine protease
MILIVLFFCISIVGAQDFCGISGKYKGLVVNGTQTERGAWPWLVAIYRIDENKLICGGTLVSADTVVTVSNKLIKLQ